MTASIRPQRLLPRLSSATSQTASRTRPAFFNQTTPGTCILCQYRTQSTIRIARTNLFEQPRRFASTSSTSNTTAAENNAAIPNIPDITNHYTIFPKTLPAGPPPNSPFDISVGDLRREFLQLQNTIHPDKYPPGPAKQQAEALSARINEAYRTLLDPLARAQYLLHELHDIDVTAEDGAAHHALDPETLMEVMEVQETIEEVGAEPGAETTITELKKQNEARVVDCVENLANAFNTGDVESARKECVRLRFWYNIAQGLKEWEPGTTEIRLVH
ncbi:HSCB C-terminal oligomerization domain-containing protein [Aspergillus alliaceus]|uniref:HSCB C-terminal oligomerization domain-containing protein n=1 Tax=Petromyces alliaceus TaxID=209559 RepID=A0A5N6G896_PETAA|nr:HSCB C-terminal oligomerization domain-containing protein [Aspergillus alliaceus]KAB8237987.1 HSCB C-terminal oligomerization domain-containing protein [Aspergillus alliaceus]KAE8386249.1 HSCB C-terminal oligomerization domain-containing protein [Aspergillus alliaceus]